MTLKSEGRDESLVTANWANPVSVASIEKPRHGGDIDTAILRFGGPQESWLDLSTGISPWTYPIPAIDESIWRELPSDIGGLITTAANYYECAEPELCPTPGSQIAIRLIPTLVKPVSAVAIPNIGYQEHAYAWSQSGHSVERYACLEQLVDLVNEKRVTNVVVINPNNPTGDRIDVKKLHSLADKLAGILLVDEAFADLDNSDSLSHTAGRNANIVILRSLGKFFGLGGARIGFVIGQNPVVKQLYSILNPWSLNGAASHIAQYALSDSDWQLSQKRRIISQSQRLHALLGDHLSNSSNFNPSTVPKPSLAKVDKLIQPKENSSCSATPLLKTQGLFTTLTGRAESIHRLHISLAEKQIWTRIGDSFTDQNQQQLNWLRFSLPGDHFDKLANRLTDLN